MVFNRLHFGLSILYLLLTKSLLSGDQVSDHPVGAQHENISILTRRERECLQLLAQGLRSEDIAKRLNIAKVTVDFHVSNAK